jgi:SAM-dependent methyltransferase
MNKMHLEFLASDDWARWLEAELVPWLAGVTDLGDNVIEVGPGPGLTTDVLRRSAARVTAVELDPALAGALAERLAGTNVDVLHADATDTGLPSDHFSAAACFSVLHHVPSAQLQDRVFAEVCRVLRPGGSFVATDGLDLDFLADLHEDDVFVPLHPVTLPARLEAAGFVDPVVEVGELELRFHTRKP